LIKMKEKTVSQSGLDTTPRSADSVKRHRTHRTPALSSDGKSFAAIKGNWKHDAVLIKGLK